MKSCHQCLETKALEFFSKNVFRYDGYQSNCKLCRNAEYIMMREEVSAKQKKLRLENIDKFRLREENYRKLNPKKVENYTKASIENLADWYVAKIIAKSLGVIGSAIPKKFVKAKREQIKLNRLLKELSK